MILHKNIFEQGLVLLTEDNQQVDNNNVRIGLPVSVSLSPTTINPGGNITATYTNRVPGRPTWLCYISGTSAIGTSPGCGNQDPLIQLHQVALVLRYNVLQVKQALLR